MKTEVKAEVKEEVAVVGVVGHEAPAVPTRTRRQSSRSSNAAVAGGSSEKAQNGAAVAGSTGGSATDGTAVGHVREVVGAGNCQRLALSQGDVAKVTRDGVTHLEWYPCESGPLLVAAGDKVGQVALWQVGGVVD